MINSGVHCDIGALTNGGALLRNGQGSTESSIVPVELPHPHRVQTVEPGIGAPPRPASATARNRGVWRRSSTVAPQDLRHWRVVDRRGVMEGTKVASMSSPNEKDRPVHTPQAGATPTSRPEHDAIEHLTTAQCWALIEARSFGRLAVQGLDGVPDVFPLNYTVHDGSIFIRSAPGSKLMSIAAHPYAAFEIDGEDEGVHWSVVLRGAARRLAVDREIQESGVQSLLSLSPTDKFNYVCVTPSSISGRRFAKNFVRSPHAPFTRPFAGYGPSRSHEETAMWAPADTPRHQPPVVIPHLPPR